MTGYDLPPLNDRLKQKIYAYFQTIWREKWSEGIDSQWLSNFEDLDDDTREKEKINMLYLLSKFMYFGNSEVRQLLLALYRDLFKYPIIASIRKRNGDTRDLHLIEAEFKQELNATRFLGVGNPSESGVHLLYYFRQEAKLSKEHFINTSEIFSTNKVDEVIGGISRTYLKTNLKDSHIKRYIFIDDFCGSGSQAKSYLKEVVQNIKFENSTAEVSYFMLFGIEKGVESVRSLNIFDKVEAVFTVDDTFKAFSPNSRYFKVHIDDQIEKDYSKITASKYGKTLFYPPLGHDNCELLIGLFHNTPDNSLPIFWSEKDGWKPIFKRYNKIY